MEYKRFGSKIVLRLDPDEEIVEQIKTIAAKENITLAAVSGLGASKDMYAGVFNPETRKCEASHVTEPCEITSLIGNINTMNGELYTHLHITGMSKSGKAVGGHMISCVISLTAEIVIDVIDGTVDRVYDDKTGLNIFKF